MAIVVVTKGAHARNTHIPPFEDGPRQFAHRFDPNEVEDVPHQVQNFIQYANALGGYHPPIVLLSPKMGDDEAEWDHIQVEMSDWRSIVETATGMAVDIL